MRIKPFRNLIFTTVSFCLLSCANNTTAEDENLHSSTEMMLNSFALSEISPELDGCSCLFAQDSSEYNESNYIFSANYDSIAFAKIDGVMTRLMLKNKKQENKKSEMLYENEDYKLQVEQYEGEKSGYESVHYSGTIHISEKHTKRKIKSPFFGECGC